jgi:hypothetical protein
MCRCKAPKKRTISDVSQVRPACSKISRNFQRPFLCTERVVTERGETARRTRSVSLYVGSAYSWVSINTHAAASSRVITPFPAHSGHRRYNGRFRHVAPDAITLWRSKTCVLGETGISCASLFKIHSGQGTRFIS